MRRFCSVPNLAPEISQGQKKEPDVTTSSGEDTICQRSMLNVQLPSSSSSSPLPILMMTTDTANCVSSKRPSCSSAASSCSNISVSAIQPEISKLKRQESVDFCVANDYANEKFFRSSFKATLDLQDFQLNFDEPDNLRRRTRSVCDPVHVLPPSLHHPSCSPSPTRQQEKQCFSPSMQRVVRSCFSPTLLSPQQQSFVFSNNNNNHHHNHNSSLQNFVHNCIGNNQQQHQQSSAIGRSFIRSLSPIAIRSSNSGAFKRRHDDSNDSTDSLPPLKRSFVPLCFDQSVAAAVAVSAGCGSSFRSSSPFHSAAVIDRRCSAIDFPTCSYRKLGKQQFSPAKFYSINNGNKNNNNNHELSSIKIERDHNDEQKEAYPTNNTNNNNNKNNNNNDNDNDDDSTTMIEDCFFDSTRSKQST